MLYDYIIIYDYKTEGKKEGNTTACHRDSTIKRTLCTLFTPRSFIVVHIGTNVHLFEYTLQRCPYKGTIVYIFTLYFVYVVCTVHGTQ